MKKGKTCLSVFCSIPAKPSHENFYIQPLGEKNHQMFCKAEFFLLHPHCFTDWRGCRPGLRGPWLLVPGDGTVPPRQLLRWRVLGPEGPAPDRGVPGTKRKGFFIFCFLMVFVFTKEVCLIKKERDGSLAYLPFPCYTRSPQYGHPTRELRVQFSIWGTLNNSLNISSVQVWTMQVCAMISAKQSPWSDIKAQVFVDTVLVSKSPWQKLSLFRESFNQGSKT